MKKKDLWKKLSYRFDSYISRGLGAQCVVLAIVILIIVFAFGIITLITPSQLSFKEAMWQSMTHLIDQGTICGDNTQDTLFLAIMIIVTLVGMACMGTTFGIITNAMGDKIDVLKKGHSQIIEEGHTLIIGFDDNIHTLLGEIKASNENWEKNRTIVVIDDMEPEVMSQMVKEKNRYKTNKKVKKSPLIFRSGSIISENTYMIASAEKARSIIINKDDDFDVIRVTLALITYLKRKGCYMNDNMPTIVSLMHDKENVEADYIAAGVHHESGDDIDPSEYKIRTLYFEDILAHIFSQVCRQPGLSFVLGEIFNYEGSEIYIEQNLKDGKTLDEAGFVGRTFLEISELSSNFIPIGLKRGNQIMLNPDLKTTIFQPGDELVHISVDDNELQNLLSEKRPSIGIPSRLKPEIRRKPYHFIFFGWSVPLDIVIDNISLYCPAGSTMTILTIHQEEEEFICPYHKKEIEKKTVTYNEQGIPITKIMIDPYHWKDVKAYLDTEINWEEDNPARPTNMVILCRDGIDKVGADQKAAVLLLNIREYLRKRDLTDEINLTAEMKLPEDQYLLQHTTSNDFVVGSEMANRMMVQVANSPYMLPVFQELLNQYGSEIYLRRLYEYVDITQEYNFEKICDVARKRSLKDIKNREIVIGWIYLGTDDTDSVVVINPNEDQRTMILNDQFNPEISLYRVVVIGMEDYGE